MSGTAKTQTALLAEQPDNTSNLILPQQMRNLTVSGPLWDVVSAAAAPGVLRGSVELGEYVTRNGGTVGAGQVLATRQTNATQVQNAFDYCATNKKFLEFAPNTIEIDNTTGILLQTSAYSGFRFFGQKNGSSLIQFHTSAPVMVIGPTTVPASVDGVVVDGIGLQYWGAAGTGNALQLGSLYFSRLANFEIYGGANVVNLIYVGSAAGNDVLPFSNHFDNFSGHDCTGSYLWYNGVSTGNKWTNTHFQNSGSALSNPAIYFGPNGAAPTETTFEQLNVEHCKVATCMFFNGGSATFIGCHWENVQLTGANPSFWRFAGGTNTNISIIGGTTDDLGLFSGNMSGTATYFSFNGDEMVSMRGHRFQAVGSPSVARDMQMRMYGVPDGMTPNTTRAMAKIEDTRFDVSYHGFLSLDATLPRATYGDFEMVDGYLGPNVFPRIAGRIVIDDPPTATVIYGALGPDVIVRYNNPIAGNITLTLATLLISGGTLGRPALDQVRVIRETTCTGAFTITVRNGALTTIGAAFTTASAGTSKVYVHTTTAGTWTQTV